MRLQPFSKAALIAIASLLSAGLFLHAHGQVCGRAQSQIRQSGWTGVTQPSFEPKGELVTYPNAEVGFICGPQLKSGSSLNQNPWFDSISRSMGITLGERFPRVAPFGPMFVNSYTGTWDNVISGRVSISSGSTIVSGVDTSFTRDVDANGAAPLFNGRLRIRDVGGVERSVQVRSVESDTRLTLMAPWGYGTVSNTVADTYYQEPGWGANTDYYYSDNYYDTALVQYINYYRTGEVRFLGYARKTADALWHSQWIGDGTVTGGPNHLPPRSMAFAGLMLRALDGRPEMWDYLEREVRATFASWVYLRKNNPTLYYDIREDGYAQLYAVMMAKVLPNSYPLYGNGTLKASSGMALDGASKRATYLAQTEDTAVNFFGRLQRADGSWRWDADMSSDPTQQFREVEQPFLVGLYLESVVLLHQLTVNANVKTNLVNQLTRSVRHLYNDTYEKNDPVTNLPGYKWRGLLYFWGGGTVAEPNKYNPSSPRTVACGLANCGDDSVTGARQLNSTIHHAFGYAYFITGDPSFREMGDEVFDASYGDRVDGIHGLADSGKGKDYDINFRASGRYLVWRLTPQKRGPLTINSRAAVPSSAVPARTVESLPNQTSAELISAALKVARRLSTDVVKQEEIESLINQIKTAQQTFRLESKGSGHPNGVMVELEAALVHARNALSMARSEAGTYESTRLRLGWAAARLNRAIEQLKPPH
ncbi:MAG: hypothetical protein ABI596_10340 [Pyrinomonadaceae bacterium]